MRKSALLVVARADSELFFTFSKHDWFTVRRRYAVLSSATACTVVRKRRRNDSRVRYV